MYSKVTSRSSQGQSSKISNSTRLVVTKTNFETLLVRHIFHTNCQESEGSVNPGRGITPVFPLLHLFLNA